MKKKCIWLLLPFIILLISGCVSSPTASNAELGQEFFLAIGRSATISGQDLQIKFVQVISDSRCPEGAT